MDEKETAGGMILLIHAVRTLWHGRRAAGMIAGLLACLILLPACSAGVPGQRDWHRERKTSDRKDLPSGKTPPEEEQQAANLLYPEGKIIEERFQPPKGFERMQTAQGSFSEYLRKLPLKEHGSKVKLYNGETKSREVYEAVVDMDIGERDLQQCADAVMRLRAEYLYDKGLFDKIHFNFTNGFAARFSRWIRGERIMVKGNNASWVKKTDYCDDYPTFRNYLDMVFSYAGTLSLSREMLKIPVEAMEIGDVFLKGALPGHCVIVVDMAENRETGDKLFMLAQSYMPAQDIHILKNEENGEMSPWYPLHFGERLETPEWSFTQDQLMRFSEE
jgi:hypothetical protein